MWLFVQDNRPLRDGFLRVSPAVPCCRVTLQTNLSQSWYYINTLPRVEWALLTRKMKFTYAHVGVLSVGFKSSAELLGTDIVLECSPFSIGCSAHSVCIKHILKDSATLISHCELAQ